LFTGPFDPSADPEGVYTYAVTALPPCVSASTTVNVDVNPAPYAGDDGSVSLCSSDPDVDLFTVLGGGPQTGGTWTDPLG
jgi:hypothetical protein